jgi:flavin reductase (DIM6/NTAB) family NADH-FMN oxidoreductase RutF
MDTTLTETEALVAAFEAGSIDGPEFPHRRHVQVAWGLARRYGREDGLQRMSAGIRAIATRAGKPEAYHETITRAWFELVAQADDLHEVPGLFDTSLLGRYYSPEHLNEGRAAWQEPDRHPLTLPPPPAAKEDVDFVQVMRRVPAAVAVLATWHERTVHATTVTSVASVSMVPPLVSVCLANGSRTLEAVQRAEAFTLSILASSQDDLAARFADAKRPADRALFAGVPHRLTARGPVIDTAAAWIACSLHGAHPCGDHHIVVGEVERSNEPDRRPLLRHDGVYH